MQTNSADFPLVGAVQNHPGAAPLSISADGGQTFASAGVAAAAVYSIASAAGPPVVIYAATDAGLMKSADGGTTWSAPASAGEIDCIAPFEIGGHSATTVQVENKGVKSNPVEILVVATALEVLAVLNEDFTSNSAFNPAKAGSIITLYISGAGQTNPPSQDGQLNGMPLANLALR